MKTNQQQQKIGGDKLLSKTSLSSKSSCHFETLKNIEKKKCLQNVIINL